MFTVTLSPVLSAGFPGRPGCVLYPLGDAGGRPLHGRDGETGPELGVPLQEGVGGVEEITQLRQVITHSQTAAIVV